MTASSGSWILPRRVLLLSVLVTAVLLLPLAGAYAWLGLTAALPVGLGYLAGVRPALTVSLTQALALALPSAMIGAVAVALRTQPFAAACFVTITCLAIAPANQLRDGLMISLAPVVALLISVPGDLQPIPTAVGMLIGAALLALIGSRLPTRAPADTVDARVAWRHAVVMAAAAGLVTYLVLALRLPHGYWVALTLTVVLRPFPDETRQRADQRVVGTVAGALIALAVGQLLPFWAAWIVLAACMLLTVGYALAGDYVRQVLFMTPVVVLMGSGAEFGQYALERILATLAGALLAGVLAAMLTRVDSRAR